MRPKWNVVFPRWVCHVEVCLDLHLGIHRDQLTSSAATKKVWSGSQDGHILLGGGLGS